MEILFRANTQAELMSLIDKQARGDYVYMYPPRQAYQRLDEEKISFYIDASLNKSNEVNLYFHFPFCKQICAFCNLFTHVSTNQEAFQIYIDYLEREILNYAPLISNRKINTLYLGGGTPSLLQPEYFSQLFQYLEKYCKCDIHNISEVAIEVSPETVSRDKFVAYKDIGINRVNLGIQSVADHELNLIGRRYDSLTPLYALETLQDIGFKNVCVDLIYGLEGQTLDGWKQSVNTVLRYAPETICAYALTLRPITGFDVRGYRCLSNNEQYMKYDYVNETLKAAGYQQETHVRWIKSGGGYQQKANHWALQNILGFGSGARSYLWYCDIRNGYSVRHRSYAYREYMKRMDDKGYPGVDGFWMDEDERRRKAVILGLICLNRKWFSNIFSIDPVAAFPEQFEILFNLDLIVNEGEYLKLTPHGIRHRDLIVQMFFSSRVQNLIKSFSYDE